MRGLLEELLGADGVSLSVRASERYAHPGEALSFHDLQLRAQSHNEVLCGFQAKGHVDDTAMNPAGKADVYSNWSDCNLVVMVGNPKAQRLKNARALAARRTNIQSGGQRHTLAGRTSRKARPTLSLTALGHK